MEETPVVRVAAIDCGTNSLRLLVADVVLDGGQAQLTDVVRTMEVVRLGQGVDRTGEFAPEALERTLAETARVRDLLVEHGVPRDADHVRFVATSASRDARNAHLLVDGVRELLGVEPEVITGAEEASLSFLGATGELHGQRPGPYLVCDLGGGSTELVLGEQDVLAARSVDVGCVRLHERHALSDPPTPDQVEALVADVRAALDVAEAEVPLGKAHTLVGVAGTVTTIAAYVQRLPTYLPERIHGAVLPVDTMLAACDELVAMPREQRAALPFMHHGRVDVIGAGALVWREVVSRVADRTGIVDVVVSEHDILDGTALALARRAAGTSP
ncbi:Ppx/GppA phosphatase [Quadrisphaera granulorum]|uniref:Ppx/GppA phosphatase n=1 Tax=Quadrisphaera granulorum TaxID=317664 RepID=A0A316AEC5_9ACTN|nr:Ppx/GppA phosphatase family protein [Quadrisphaera granulorum]PWJ56093.1 Ppx/GppA phosphatase [Quadrisphaera granulorum]SZE94727.1 Ppx/GppA phosphatase [Quadrisphaera granulorum]